MPIETFLAAKRNAYVEVYRATDPAPGWCAATDGEATRLLGEHFVYGFGAHDPSRQLSCATLIARLFGRAGAPAPRPRARSTHPNVSRALLQVGMRDGVVHCPSQYVVDPELRLVSVLDNGQLALTVSNAVVMRTPCSASASGSGRIASLSSRRRSSPSWR